MSEEHDAPPEQPPRETPELAPLPRNDWLLQNLVNFANEAGVESGVTLQVGGLLVSGTMISFDKYLDEFSDLFGAGFGKNSELGKQIGTAIKGWKPERKAPSAEDAQDWPPPQFVHLRNASFFFPGQRAFPSSQVLWRGRLSEVGGFFLGVLAESEGN